MRVSDDFILPSRHPRRLVLFHTGDSGCFDHSPTPPATYCRRGKPVQHSRRQRFWCGLSFGGIVIDPGFLLPRSPLSLVTVLLFVRVVFIVDVPFSFFLSDDFNGSGGAVGILSAGVEGIRIVPVLQKQKHEEG